MTHQVSDCEDDVHRKSLSTHIYPLQTEVCEGLFIRTDNEPVTDIRPIKFKTLCQW